MNLAVVPFKCHAGKAGAVDFLRDFVVLFESLGKMIQVGIANVLDGKSVNNECKHDGAPFVVPEPGGGGCHEGVEFSKAVLEEFVGKDACLGETAHAMAHLKVDPGVTGKLIELVLFDKFLGDVCKLDVDVLWPVERGVQIEVLRSMVASLALHWERTLLTSNLMSSIDPVEVPTSPGYVMLLPPIVMHVRSALSPFSDMTLQTTLE